MIITPNGLKEQIYNRVKQMISKSKEHRIKFDNISDMIVTSYGVYSELPIQNINIVETELFITGVSKDDKGNQYVFIQDSDNTVNTKMRLSVLNIDELYTVYQQLSYIISPSTAIYADIIEEA